MRSHLKGWLKQLGDIFWLRPALLIYGKNQQTDLSPAQRDAVVRLTQAMKGSQ